MVESIRPVTVPLEVYTEMSLLQKALLLMVARGEVVDRSEARTYSFYVDIPAHIRVAAAAANGQIVAISAVAEETIFEPDSPTAQKAALYVTVPTTDKGFVQLPGVTQWEPQKKPVLEKILPWIVGGSVAAAAVLPAIF